MVPVKLFNRGLCSHTCPVLHSKGMLYRGDGFRIGNVTVGLGNLIDRKRRAAAGSYVCGLAAVATHLE